VRNISTAGIDEYDLWSILNELVLKRYSIQVDRPFYRVRNISNDDYFRELRNYFKTDGKKSAIISLEGDDIDHWSVLRKITHKKIFLFDSDSIKTIHIEKCSVQRFTKRTPYLLSPRMTFFLYKK
jgi:hypothetical protein